MSIISTVLGWITSAAKNIIPGVAPTPVSGESSDVTKVLSGIKTIVSNAIGVWTSPDLQTKIEDGLSLALAVEQIGAVIDPAIAIAEVPTEVLQMLIPYLAKMIGLVEVSQGVFGPPPDNSRYDPKTGNFLPGSSWL